jgi:LemA protein
MWIGLLIILGLAVILAFVIIGGYNGLVTLRNRYKNAFAQIDVQLKRRYDLIPNLVETVKGYAAHEQGTFQKVVEARNAAMATGGVEAKAKAENALTGALKSIFALAESYPDLKANQNFLALQTELSGLEEAIQNARRYYNAVVRDLNTRCEAFPSNLVA